MLWNTNVRKSRIIFIYLCVMKVIISGYGKMGRMVEAKLKERGIEIAACSEDICSTPPELARECVCIDFTTPDAFRANYKFIAANFKAAVVGTTGWYDIKDSVFNEFEKGGCTLIWSANFSIGVNALFAAVEKASAILKDHGYTPDISETHHIHKLDKPSGTAKILGNIVADNLGVEAPIESFREGEVPGTHTVKFLSNFDRLSFTHEAFSREGFAEGAVAAAMLSEGLFGIHEFKNLII